jgi:hypothetical protein
MPSGSFYITLNSNVDYPGNKASKFTIPLAKKLEFNARWCVGLSEFIYPHSWPTLGTTEDQFIDVHWKNGGVLRVPLETATFKTWQELERQLIVCIRNGVEQLKKAIQDARSMPRNKRDTTLPPPTEDAEDNLQPPPLNEDNEEGQLKYPTLTIDTEPFSLPPPSQSRQERSFRDLFDFRKETDTKKVPLMHNHKLQKIHKILIHHN